MCCKQNQKKGSFFNSKLPATSCARPAAAAQSQFPIPPTCNTPRLPLKQCNAESTTTSLFPGCCCCPARRHFCSAGQTNWRTDMDGASDWLALLLLLPLPIGICRINTAAVAAAQAASEQRRASFAPATTTTTNKALPTKQFLLLLLLLL